MEATITVTTKEGTFLYDGVRADGSARWPFYRKEDDGSLKGGAAPKRFRRALSKNKKNKGKKQNG